MHFCHVHFSLVWKHSLISQWFKQHTLLVDSLFFVIVVFSKFHSLTTTREPTPRKRAAPSCQRCPLRPKKWAHKRPIPSHGRSPEGESWTTTLHLCLCSTSLQGQRKAIQKLVCTMPNQWQLKPGHWCFLEPTSETTWNGKSNELEKNNVLSHCRWNPVSHFPPDIYKGRAIIAWTAKKRSFENKELLINTILASNLQNVYNRKSQ